MNNPKAKARVPGGCPSAAQLGVAQLGRPNGNPVFNPKQAAAKTMVSQQGNGSKTLTSLIPGLTMASQALTMIMTMDLTYCLG